MSDGINSIHLVGNLGADPELRHTASGKAVCNLRLATNRGNKTTWHRVVAWEKAAEFCGKFLKKGDQIYVEGWIDYREYTDQDSQARVSAEISARTIQALGSGDRPVDGNIEPPRDYSDEAPF